MLFRSAIESEGGPELHRAFDGGKDQSYFLFATTREQLDFLRFPLGSYSKDETRELASELGLNVAAKPDSQDICFVPEGRYTDVIEKVRPGAAEPGDIVHLDGRVLGRHRGVMYYTIGQRRGLGLEHGSGSEPLFVVRIDADAKQVVVGPRKALERTKVYLEEVNWIGPGDLGPALDGLPVRVKLRSTSEPKPATLRWDGELSVELAKPEAGVSPGQACVIYADRNDAQRTLGGGWITGTA